MHYFRYLHCKAIKIITVDVQSHTCTLQSKLKFLFNAYFKMSKVQQKNPQNKYLIRLHEYCSRVNKAVDPGVCMQL